jgi:hypothetical protein
MATPQDRLDNLIVSGLVGPKLGAVLAKNSDELALVVALIGAAASATKTAYKNARKANQHVLVVINRDMFVVHPDGHRTLIKRLPHSNRTWPGKIILK